MRETAGGWLALVLAPSGYAFVRRWLCRNGEDEIEAIGLGRLEDFPPGTNRTVTLGEEKAIIARLEDGTFRAVSGTCTHLGCSIRYEQSAGQPEFACNCHDSRFDLDGINLSGPAPNPLLRFEVEISGKELRLVKSPDTNGQL